MLYQPSEFIEFRVKRGKSKKMVEGVVKIDLTGDGITKLKEYYKKLEAKRLSIVTYPKMNGVQWEVFPSYSP